MRFSLPFIAALAAVAVAAPFTDRAEGSLIDAAGGCLREGASCTNSNQCCKKVCWYDRGNGRRSCGGMPPSILERDETDTVEVQGECKPKGATCDYPTECCNNMCAMDKSVGRLSCGGVPA